MILEVFNSQKWGRKIFFKIAKFLYWVVKKDIEESSYSQISASIVNRAWNHVGRISSFFEEAYEEGASSSSSSSSSPSQMDLGRLKYYQIFLLSTEIRTLNMPNVFQIHIAQILLQITSMVEFSLQYINM